MSVRLSVFGTVVKRSMTDPWGNLNWKDSGVDQDELHLMPMNSTELQFDMI
jgi:hypothetical protein